MQFPLLRSVLLTFLLLGGTLLLAKQTHPENNNDSTLNSQPLSDSTIVKYFNSNFEKLGRLSLISYDTSINGIQIYDPLYRNHRFFQGLGNYGQAAASLLPFEDIGKSGFDYGIHTLDKYLYQNDSVRYFRIQKTFTELSYIQGAKKEQNFNAVFSRNIFKSLNLGFNFHVSQSPGAYVHQKTNHINFVLTAQYFSRNRRYGVVANYTISKLRNYENGGIKYDSLFTMNLEPNRNVIPVNLYSAENRISDGGFFMKHYFDITRKQKRVADSVWVVNQKPDLGRLSYSFQYNRNIHNFIDGTPDSIFFPPPIYDSTGTYDSVTIKQFTNILTWSNPSYNPDGSPRLFQLEAGIRQQVVVTSDYLETRSVNSFVPYALVSLTPYESIRLTGYGDLAFGDYNGGDLTLQGTLTTILGRKTRNAGSIRAFLLIKSHQPGWFYSHYHGNFQAWDHNWNKQGTFSFGGSYGFKFAEAGFAINQINDYIYLDTNSLPKQFEPSFSYLKVYLKTDLDLGKFNIRSKFIYQTVQGTNVLRLPVFMGDLQLYFSQPVFHGAAIFQPGLSVLYNTPFFANAYNPALRSFYLQDKKEIGNTFYLDLFINLKIQRARLFFAYTHINAGWMERNYFSTPDYPMQDAAFKFGVSWRFHD